MLTVVVVAFLLMTIINVYVVMDMKGTFRRDGASYILTEAEAAALVKADGGAECIQILGASVVNGEPSPMLADRLDTGLRLYGAGASENLLLTGDDGGDSYYNEVAAMESYVLARADEFGVDPQSIYIDNAGYSTYESAYRMRSEFGVETAIIVTQEYHLYRAVYDARALGIDAYGVAAPATESGQFRRSVREYFARVKDFFWVIFDVKPQVLGDGVEIK